jgi:hypothetical protein
VAVTRKLCVALSHVMMGHAIGALERLDTLETKLSKFATEIGPLRSLPSATLTKLTSYRKNSMCYAVILDLTTCLQRLGRWST